MAETKLRKIGGGGVWTDGDDTDLRSVIEAAIAEDDRVLIISIGKTPDGTRVRNVMRSRDGARISFLELVGALHNHLHQMHRELDDDA